MGMILDKRFTQKYLFVVVLLSFIYLLLLLMMLFISSVNFVVLFD